MIAWKFKGQYCVQTYTTVAYDPALSGMSFICVMKMEVTVTKSAVPSMLTVAPMGSTNLEMRWSTLFLSSMQRKVMGNAAALKNNSEGRAGRAEWRRKELDSRSLPGLR